MMKLGPLIRRMFGLRDIEGEVRERSSAFSYGANEFLRNAQTHASYTYCDQTDAKPLQGS
jgi:hypothetical protein